MSIRPAYHGVTAKLQHFASWRVQILAHNLQNVPFGPEEAASGKQEIEDRYKVLFESHPTDHASKLDQVYAIGNRICAITEWSVMQKKACLPAYAPDFGAPALAWPQADSSGSPAERTRAAIAS